MAAFDVVVTRARRLIGTLPDGTSLAVPGALPEGYALDLNPGLDPAAAALVRERLAPAIAALEATLPLERDPGNGTWEGLSVEVSGDRGYLVARNLLGARERLHVFGLDRSRASARELGDWFGSRATPRADTSWDAARAGRMVLVEDNFGRRASYIDPGAVRLVEIAHAVGAAPFFSCEGHHRGGYLCYVDDAAGRRLHGALAGAGWQVSEWWRGLSAHMPPVDDLAARDACWRETCAGLERALGLEPDAGREALARLNLHQAAEAAPTPAP